MFDYTTILAHVQDLVVSAKSEQSVRSMSTGTHSHDWL